jgi:hypothetical protein
MGDTYHSRINGPDILSHPNRTDTIYILTLDAILSADIYERLSHDPRMGRYKLVRPESPTIGRAVEEIDRMARYTVSSRLLIIDVRKATSTRLKQAYNKIVGYNRKDFNKLCFTILIGDGPVNLFQAGKLLDVFVPHLSSHRIDYHPAVFFYDPFLHYEPGEVVPPRMHDEFVLPDVIPRRLVPYFRDDRDIRVDRIRRYFRAIDKSENVRRRRLRRLRGIYKKRIAEQFPHHQDQLRTWLCKEGIRLASEKLHLYPLFFEEWVYDLVTRAARS